MFTAELYTAVETVGQIWKSIDNGWSWSYFCDYPAGVGNTFIIKVSSTGILYGCVNYNTPTSLFIWNGVSWDGEDIEFIFPSRFKSAIDNPAFDTSAD